MKIMPKKRLKARKMVRRKTKFGPLVLLTSAIVAGFVFAQNGSNSQTKDSPPRIDSISPATGVPNTLVTIYGSGFTTQKDYETRIRGEGLPAGNYLRIAGSGTMGPPTFSPDGKTLKFQLAISSGEVPKNCEPGTTGVKCQIPLQVVNADGTPSNIVHFQLYIVERPLVIYMSLDSQNPAGQNIAAGTNDVEVLRFKLKSGSENPVNINITDFTFKTIPENLIDWNIYCKDLVRDIKITDASNGETMASYSTFADNVVGCSSKLSTWLSLSPGQEKIFSVRISIPNSAPAGREFQVAVEKTFSGEPYSISGDWAVTSNPITISP